MSGQELPEVSSFRFQFSLPCVDSPPHFFFSFVYVWCIHSTVMWSGQSKEPAVPSGTLISVFLCLEGMI